MIVIDTTVDLQTHIEILSDSSSVWFPVFVDDKIHSVQNTISFFAVRTHKNNYIINVSHTDGSAMKLDSIFSFNSKVWMFNTKSILHHINNNFRDVDSLYFLQTGTLLEYNNLFQSELLHYKKIGYTRNVLKSAPILKLARIVFNFIDKLNIDFNKIPYGFDWFNSIYIPVLSYMEKNPIPVDVQLFKQKYNAYPLYGNYAYTQYNPFTSTHRPSSRFGGVNFAAMNKNDGTRNIVVGDGVLLQMDYDAYHVRLIADMIGYDLPTTSVHQWFADTYDITYAESKLLTFRLLYGNASRDELVLPFFEKVYEFIDKHWNFVHHSGYVQTLHSKIPLTFIDDPSPSKVFNYLVQSIETERNIDRIHKIIPILDSANISLILYTYDSFIFNVKDTSDITVLPTVRDILEDRKYPVKITWGDTYNEL